jgi:hypothetical protein
MVDELRGRRAIERIVCVSFEFVEEMLLAPCPKPSKLNKRLKCGQYIVNMVLKREMCTLWTPYRSVMV